LHFDSDGIATCPEGSETYRLIANHEGVETVRLEHTESI
jgi:hypothetical protein